jgi:microsomal prostaglandin-E synthase 2
VYAYRSCPFCNKVFAFLDHHKVPYVAVEVNPLFKVERKWQSYKLVPFAIVNGKQVNNSDDIIDAVAAALGPSSTGYRVPASARFEGADPLKAAMGCAGIQPRSEAQSEKERVWRSWVNDSLVHTLSPNIYRTPAEALQAFAYIGECPALGRERLVARYQRRVRRGGVEL